MPPGPRIWPSFVLMNTIALVVAILLFLVGMTGIIVPVMPGTPLIWLGMLLYGLLTGFSNLTVYFFIFQGLLALAAMAVDYAATAWGSRRFGGGKASLWGAVIGLLVGLFFLPYGLLLGPFLGAFFAELIFTRQGVQALRSGIGALIGFWGGLSLKLLLGTVMIVWFFIEIC
jgi:uncharacterized protein YqgC (DUF456 family)